MLDPLVSSLRNDEEREQQRGVIVILCYLLTDSEEECYNLSRKWQCGPAHSDRVILLLCAA